MRERRTRKRDGIWEDVKKDEKGRGSRGQRLRNKSKGNEGISITVNFTISFLVEIFIIPPLYPIHQSLRSIMIISVYIYLTIYVSIYASMYVYMHVSMYLCMYICMYVFMYICMYVSIYVCIYVSIYVCI